MANHLTSALLRTPPGIDPGQQLLFSMPVAMYTELIPGTELAGGRRQTLAHVHHMRSEADVSEAYSRVLVHAAEEQRADTVHCWVGSSCLLPMEAEFPSVPRHGAQELSRVVRTSDELSKQVETL